MSKESFVPKDLLPEDDFIVLDNGEGVVDILAAQIKSTPSVIHGAHNRSYAKNFLQRKLGRNTSVDLMIDHLYHARHMSIDQVSLALGADRSQIQVWMRSANISRRPQRTQYSSSKKS